MQGEKQEQDGGFWDTIKGAAKNAYTAINPWAGISSFIPQDSRLGQGIGAIRNAAGTVLNSAGNLVASEVAGLGSAALQVPRLFTTPGSSTDQFFADRSAAGLEQANSFFRNAVQPYKQAFNAAFPGEQIPVKDFQDSQSKDTTIKGGNTQDDIDRQLNQDTIAALDSIYKINTGTGGEKYLDVSSLGGGVDVGEKMYNVLDPNGNIVGQMSQSQLDANADSYEATYGAEGFSLQEVAPPPDPFEETLTQMEPVARQTLQEQYNILQKESGIVEATTQLKELETQMAAIEMALIKQRDAVMEDPDFSLATKEGRINYIFNNSMEARTYEALTKRSEVLGDFINRQNEQIKTQLGFAQQDFQNALAYQSANQQSQDNYSLQFNEGTPYVFNKQTGQYEVGASVGGSKSVEPDVLKALNSNQDWQNLQTAETHWSNMNAIVNAYGQPNDANTWNQLANSAADVRNFAVALARIQDPASARLADAGDAASGQSIQAQASDYVAMLLNDRNATPRNLMEFWNNAGRLITSTYRPRGQAAEQQIRAAYGSGGTTYSSDSGGGGSVDTTAFVAAAKRAGYTDAQIQQYLAQQGGSSSAFNW
jgi:hypothetical protein